MQYDQPEKKACRHEVIEHAVRALTTERSTSVCVQRNHVEQVWKQLHETEEALAYFTPEQRQEIEKEIEQWKLFHDSRVQSRKPSDLRVCYLGGDNPINDLEVLVENGLLCQNIWAIEKDSKALKAAWESINKSDLRNVRLFKGDILTFLEDFEGEFDIIYYDACGTLPASKQHTLKVIGYVFLHNKLTSPGALITNFSHPAAEQLGDAPEPEQLGDAPSNERTKIRNLSEKYLSYRLANTYNDPGGNEEYLKGKSDEEIYSDYITYQIIDSAYLYIPAYRLLSSTRNSLLDQIFVSRSKVLKDLRLIIDKNFEEMGETSWLYELTRCMKSSNNELCQDWMTEIFPDWKSSSILKNHDLEVLLLTHLLSCSFNFISKFANKDFKEKGIGPLVKSLYASFEDDRPVFPGFCDAVAGDVATKMIAGLLYGQMAYPSFPVMHKLLRRRYTAKSRQMFADVVIFDKCRNVYEQFPSVDCSCFAIFEPKQQMVFRMAVDGLKKHMGGICCDVFDYCHVASMNAITEGGVSFWNNSLSSFPERTEYKSS